MILATCLVSSFKTEKAGREVAIVEASKIPDISEASDRILVPISNPATIEKLLDLAILIKEPKSPEPLYALAVVKDDSIAKEKVLMSERMLQKAIEHASSTETAVRVVTRVDLNIASGIIRAIKDLMITEVIIGWNAKISTATRIFGSVLDMLVENTEQMIVVTKLVSPINTYKKIAVVVPPNAEFEQGTLKWLKAVKYLGKQTGANVDFLVSPSSEERWKEVVKNTKPHLEINFKQYEEWDDLFNLSRKVNIDDLLIVISARKATVSYNPHLDFVPKQLAKYFDLNSFLIIYPEQKLEADIFKHMQ
jgi:hypothetical protein